MSRYWRITREDDDDLGFALDCLVAWAVTLEEFKQWVYEVLQDTEDFPQFLIDLIDFTDRNELYRALPEVVGYRPYWAEGGRQDNALTGVAYARDPDYRHDSLTRGEALRALLLHLHVFISPVRAGCANIPLMFIIT